MSAGEGGRMVARLTAALADGRAGCRACLHACALGDGEVGRCGVRMGASGLVVNEVADDVSRVEVEPVERVPLARFRPGTNVLAIGAPGSPLPSDLEPFRAPPRMGETRFATTAELTDIALRAKVAGVAFAHGDPFVGVDRLVDVTAGARAEGLFTAAVTTGLAGDEAQELLLPLVDAWNVVLLGGEDEYERRGVRGGLAAARRLAERARSRGAHVELTLLLVAGAGGESYSSAAAREVATIAESLGRLPVHVASPPHFETAAPVKVVLRASQELRSRGADVILAGAYAG